LPFTLLNIRIIILLIFSASFPIGSATVSICNQHVQTPFPSFYSQFAAHSSSSNLEPRVILQNFSTNPAPRSVRQHYARALPLPSGDNDSASDLLGDMPILVLWRQLQRPRCLVRSHSKLIFSL
jgi:hypothetical protein